MIFVLTWGRSRLQLGWIGMPSRPTFSQMDSDSSPLSMPRLRRSGSVNQESPIIRRACRLFVPAIGSVSDVFSKGGFRCRSADFRRTGEPAATRFCWGAWYLRCYYLAHQIAGGSRHEAGRIIEARRKSAGFDASVLGGSARDDKSVTQTSWNTALQPMRSGGSPFRQIKKKMRPVSAGR
jgi:hypothetical protein